ncbi:hypothetical protein C4569_00620 [Candidatus Parcubacteria bacterium]|nr:MAG: hypothetical protein C4569_00620 [Candidatus Parcubacteria bacterium]
MPGEMSDAIISRHADKGSWKIDRQDLENDDRLDEKDVDVIMNTLNLDFSDLKETSLSKDGLIRSIRLGDKIFNDIVDVLTQEQKKKFILLVADSGKDRAKLTKAIVANRIAQKEDEFNAKAKDLLEINILQLEPQNMPAWLKDSHNDPYEPYGERVKKGELTEDEAITQWLKDLNQPGLEIVPEKLPKESGDRYRSTIRKLMRRITSEKVPLSLLAVGHCGPLGQIEYEDKKGDISPEDIPNFCELYRFDKKGNFLKKESVEI